MLGVFFILLFAQLNANAVIWNYYKNRDGVTLAMRSKAIDIYFDASTNNGKGI